MSLKDSRSNSLKPSELDVYGGIVDGSSREPLVGGIGVAV